MNLDQAYHFSGQKEGERIILVVRRHWFNVLQSLFSVFIMIFLLFGSYFFLPAFFSVLRAEPFTSVFVFLENMFAMITFILFFLIWIDYYFDIWIVTNKRIVNVEQKGLFSREVSELELEKIQDITTEVLGIIPTFMNYGNVYIQTAAEKERFRMAHVPDPYRIKDVIMNLQKLEERADKEDLGAIIRGETKRKEI